MSLQAAGAPPGYPVRCRRECGATMVELMLALPVVLLFGLGIAQFMLVYQAKHALDYALTQAARQGAVAHASRDSIYHGLAVGLVPYLYGANDWNQLLLAEASAAEHVEQGLAAGWITLRQRSPTVESFADWAEPALDEMGEPIPGVEEIANDNLDNRRLRTPPASGVAGAHLDEPIGRLSGQTLADANLLRLELAYGVRLVVPVVGAIIVRTLSLWNGCSQALQAPPDAAGGEGVPGRITGNAAGRRERLGLLVLDSVDRLESLQSWMCGFLVARDGEGSSGGRIPVRVSATVRMMSTARRSELAQGRLDTASGLLSSAPGSPQSTDGPSPAGDGTPGGEGGTSSGGRTSDGGEAAGSRGVGDAPVASRESSLANGFLQIGGDRPYRAPASHPALCPT